MTFDELSEAMGFPLATALQAEEATYLEAVLTAHGGLPPLNALWRYMDEAWRDLACDPACLDDRVAAYYRHPVWLLNGLFTELDPLSNHYRNVFQAWVERRNPLRIFDIGGSLGALARRISTVLPHATVEVLEPYPSPLAVALAEKNTGLHYVSELEGNYDVMIATDVFEHVDDPLGLVATCAAHLKVGGGSSWRIAFSR